MKKVLILGVAPAQMDALLMLKESGYETYACAMAKDGPGASVADNFSIINILDIAEIIEYVCKNKIDLVYSVGSDLAMPVACKVSEQLSLPHFVSSKIATTCNHKDLMRNALGKSYRGNLPFQIVMDQETTPEINFPFIMKPSDSQGQRGVLLVNSLQEYRDNFFITKGYSRSGKMIIEKYINGPELSVNAYTVDGKLCFMIASDRETWPQHTGLIHKHVVPAKVMSGDMIGQLERIVIEACERIGIFNGPVYMQIKVERGIPYIIEITPRLDGCHMWKLLIYYTGINLLKLTFEHLANQDTSELDKLTPQPESYELTFFCQEPHTVMDCSKFNIPGDSLAHFFYYKTGDRVRPVNGIFEKTGYCIRKLRERTT